MEAASNAIDLHRSAFVSDAHCDTLLDVLAGERHLGERSASGHIDLPRLHDGGVTAQVFAIWTPTARYTDATRHGIEAIDAFYQEIEANDDLRMALRVEDLDAAYADGAVAGILSLEGAEPLAGSLAILRTFYRLGVRLITLTWNFRNEAADGVKESISGGGLTHFGRALVEECNRLGIVLDVSHLAAAGVRDVLALSKQPVIASHSNAAGLYDHPRNLTDGQLQAIAKSGGAIGVTFVPAFLRPDKENASILDVLDHIDYIAKVVGVEHVMLGSDFDGLGDTPPAGLEDVSHLLGLTAGLLARGYSEEAVRAIIGLNFRRVFARVTALS